MKFETLLTRYKNLGYIPKGLEEELELDSIILWLYKTHDIYIGLIHNDHINVKSYNKVLPNAKIKRFGGCHVWNVNTDYDNKVYGEKYFDNPFDAKFHFIKSLYPALKFQKY